jgi:hypothetical protein
MGIDRTFWEILDEDHQKGTAEHCAMGDERSRLPSNNLEPITHRYMLEDTTCGPQNVSGRENEEFASRF